MATILRSPLLARLEDDTEAYAGAIITHSTPTRGESVARCLAGQAMASLLASISMLRASIAARPGVGIDTSAEVQTLTQAAVDVLAERPGAPERLLPLLERLL